MLPAPQGDRDGVTETEAATEFEAVTETATELEWVPEAATEADTEGVMLGV
jgi:hypothetical protein